MNCDQLRSLCRPPRSLLDLTRAEFASCVKHYRNCRCCFGYLYPVYPPGYAQRLHEAATRLIDEYMRDPEVASVLEGVTR